MKTMKRSRINRAHKAAAKRARHPRTALAFIGPVSEVGTEINDILNMRVGCWRPPVSIPTAPTAR
jgi:hypothetical protein